MIRWPRFAWFTLLAVLFSGLVTALLLELQIRNLDLVERYDFTAYLHSSLLPVSWWNTYPLLMVAPGHPAIPEQADQAALFYMQSAKRDPKVLHDWLEKWVYHGSVWWVLKVPFAASFVVALFLCYWGRRFDQRYSKETHDGRNLRGPGLVTETQWNQHIPLKERAFYIESK